MTDAIPLAVIGGTGLEQAFDALEERLEIDTPYGPTSEPVAVGEIAGRRVAFLPRHGRGHALPPGSIPARANAWALASLGVRGIVSSAAVGSLDPDLPPPALVIPDQLLDRTRHRTDSFFDGTVPGEPVRHLPLADPFCPVLRLAAAEAAPTAYRGATVAVIEGPRFSTRAESRSLRRDGAHLVNMTLLPEVALAAELGIGTVTVCVVTDMDAGVAEGDETVSAEVVYARFAGALPEVVASIERTIAAVPHDYAGRVLLDERARGDVLARPLLGRD
ncbi:MTAP family purine nucleoside phosphorylase [Microbacterium aquimaris]|uniref:MTAP family purine nucleoside phosphorylase n=1 Tax=Microbacterium aquimaris TaxID=459816 RepID=UPI002AD3807E|nr:MTAP family purine nucleoside phosphorylase [Microbacterium aquimaris]MDZ8275932.1 MTAP family purine nucleoside phosphorylase [Microbacterium aquimaris]